MKVTRLHYQFSIFNYESEMLRMSVSRSESYKAAGVDVTAGYEAVKLMKPMVESTFTKGVMGTAALAACSVRSSMA
jgi:hypothetical protein